jgi:hypothetical protein
MVCRVTIETQISLISETEVGIWWVSVLDLWPGNDCSIVKLSANAA